MANEKVVLGTKPTKAIRDAIHVAVITAVCDDFELKPGQHVGYYNGKASAAFPRKLGIVDPYMQSSICLGELFWLCLYPNTVTGMRHHWEHPAFEDTDTNASTDTKEQAEQWLRRYAIVHNPYDSPDKAFERLIKGLTTGQLFFNGSDLHGFYDLDDPDNLVKYGSIYLGRVLTLGNFEFSCSC